MLRELEKGIYFDTDNCSLVFGDQNAVRPIARTLPALKVREDFLTEGKLRRLVIVLTERCNLGCSYCYANQGDYGKGTNSRINSQTIDQIVRYLNTHFPNGIDQIQFFGGEPLLESKSIEYFIDRYLEFRTSSDTVFSMVTNGTVLNQRILSLLKDRSIRVTVSLDGNRGAHDFYRMFKKSREGSYETVINNIRRLTSEGVTVGIQLTINDRVLLEFLGGRLDVDEFSSLMKQLGVGYVHLSPVIGFSGSNGLPKSEYRRVLTKIQRALVKTLDAAGIVSNTMSSACSFIKEPKVNPGYCGAGIDEISIDLDGEIYPCFMFINQPNLSLGNIRDGIINNELLRTIRGYTKEDRYPCGTCYFKDQCSACLGANLMENGDFRQPALDFCSFQQNGFDAALITLLDRRSR